MALKIIKQGKDIAPKDVRANGQKYDWLKVKEDFILENLRGDGAKIFTLEQCAKKWELSPGTVRNVAAKQKWVDELRKRMIEVRERVTLKVEENIVVDEVEIRTRQIAAGRMLQRKALERLATLNPDYLSAYAASRVYELGSHTEREAAGLSKNFTMVPGNTDEGGKHISVVEHMQRQQRLRQRAGKFLEFIEGESRRVK